jgi:hypothetical protein
MLFSFLDIRWIAGEISSSNGGSQTDIQDFVPSGDRGQNNTTLPELFLRLGNYQ